MADQTLTKGSNSPIDWRLLAEDDLAIAEHITANMNPIPTAGAAFHCQQAVEKFLKGALTIFGDEPPFIHDLDKLCSFAEKHRPSFVSISSLCTAINYFSVQPRYDRGISLSDEDLRLVLSHARTIKQFLQKELPELFKDGSN